MSAECARAAAWSLPAERSGRSPFATRTSFIAPRIRLSDARENEAAEPPETTESATKTAAHSAATCVGERIGRHFGGAIGRTASPKRGIRRQKFSLNANFVQAQSLPKRLLLLEVGRVPATLPATGTRRASRPEARASPRFPPASPRRGA